MTAARAISVQTRPRCSRPLALSVAGCSAVSAMVVASPGGADRVEAPLRQCAVGTTAPRDRVNTGLSRASSPCRGESSGASSDDAGPAGTPRRTAGGLSWARARGATPSKGALRGLRRVPLDPAGLLLHLLLLHDPVPDPGGPVQRPRDQRPGQDRRGSSSCSSCRSSSIFVYLITRGQGMTERAIAAQQAAQAAQKDYIRQTAGTGPTRRPRSPTGRSCSRPARSRSRSSTPSRPRPSRRRPREEAPSPVRRRRPRWSLRTPGARRQEQSAPACDVRRASRTPRAAAIAGIVFAVLLSTSVVLLHWAAPRGRRSERVAHRRVPADGQ